MPSPGSSVSNRGRQCNPECLPFEQNLGSIIRARVTFGFMEEPNLERALHYMLSHRQIDLPTDTDQCVVHVALENLLASKSMGFIRRIQFQAFIVLRNISRPAYYHYGLGDKVQLSAEIFPINVL